MGSWKWPKSNVTISPGPFVFQGWRRKVNIAWPSYEQKLLLSVPFLSLSKPAQLPPPFLLSLLCCDPKPSFSLPLHPYCMWRQNEKQPVFVKTSSSVAIVIPYPGCGQSGLPPSLTDRRNSLVSVILEPLGMGLNLRSSGQIHIPPCFRQLQPW